MLLEMSEAKKDKTPILLYFKDPIPNNRDDLRRWDGLVIVGKHHGLSEDGFDLGWSVAAPVGFGGFPDDWFLGWLPVPSL